MPSVSGNRTKLAFVSVKSFGDLVIAATTLARLARAGRERVSLLVGEHLAPLLAALSPSVKVRFLDERLDGPAALFDARRLGGLAAVRSGWSLRRAIGNALEPDETLIFDVMGVRERLLTLNRPAMALPAAANIYAAYESLLDQNGLAREPAPNGTAGGQLVRIFAGARMVHRQPPVALLHRIVERISNHGARPEIILLEGERPDLESGKRGALPITVIPRDFGGMIDAVQQADAVISPDSMTAHLAEYCRKPVLVLTPEEKFYWMPRFAAQHGTIALFDEDLSRGPFDAFVNRYVVA